MPGLGVSQQKAHCVDGKSEAQAVHTEGWAEEQAPLQQGSHFLQALQQETAILGKEDQRDVELDPGALGICLARHSLFGR